MMLRSVSAWFLFAMVLFVSVSASYIRYDQSAASIDRTDSQLRTISEHARELIALREATEIAIDRPRPAQDLLATVNDTLRSIDLSTNRDSRIELDSDHAIDRGLENDGIEYRQQVVDVRLDRMTVAEIGAFLNQWRRTQPLWTPIELSLLHSQSNTERDGNQDSRHERYDLLLTVAAVYIASE